MNQQVPPPSSVVRTTISVREDVLSVFDEMASVTGVSRSRAIGDWLLDTADAAREMARLLHKARMQPKLFAREMQSYALGVTDLTQELLEQVSKLPSKGATPRPSNTGGKVPKNGGGTK